MNNVIMLPTAKTYLYNNKALKINKKTINEAVNLILDKITMTKEQKKDLNKRVKLFEEIKELLPPDKINLLLEYEELENKECTTILEEAISFVLENENLINDVMVSNY